MKKISNAVIKAGFAAVAVFLAIGGSSAGASTIIDGFELPDLNLTISVPPAPAPAGTNVQQPRPADADIGKEFRAELKDFPFPCAANKNFSIIQPEKPMAVSPPPLGEFSTEFQRRINSFAAGRQADEESGLIAVLGDISGPVPVLAREAENRFIQQICDHVYDSSFGLSGSTVRPKCRIQASLVPNATADSNGEIFISAGLLGIISDLDSVEYVLGHEMGHFVGRHVPKKIDALITIDLAKTAATAFFFLGGGGFFYIPGTPMSELSRITRLANTGAVKAGFIAYSYENEWEADRLGHQAALAAGARQEAFARSWEEQLEYDAKYFGPASLWTELFRLLDVHPDTLIRKNDIPAQYQKYRRLCDNHLDAGGRHINRLPEKYYSDYTAIHKMFEPAVQKFGRMLSGK